ncbi:aldose epimerase family protein [Lapidilactobacillus mulanensis]|uniref:Maltose epimerase n=1 Tax=Lapidilactobacillus mulanensis TaxID=2485999 RepID=A0ABW4DPB5_9LACO|nr:aldose epimerase family protein [Lapidilactobacillus mulanensis]
MSKREVFSEFNGETIYKLTLTNQNNMSISCLSFGANWYELLVPTKNGKQNLLLNFPKVEDYVETNQYLNMSIGRTAGRIGKGEFTLAGKTYHVDANEGENTLHGGPHGFNQINWNSRIEGNQIIFDHQIKQEDDSFPGDLDVTITYTLTDDNQVLIDYKATSNVLSLFNPTSHAYWNLNADDRNVNNLNLYLRSGEHLELDDEKIPTGKVVANANTPYDFRHLKLIGSAIDGLQGIPEKGIDDVYILDDHDDSLPDAILENNKQNISVEIYTERNAIVLFTANSFGADQPYIGRTGQPQVGVALEAQTAPNAVFDSRFGDFSIEKGQTKHYQTKYRIMF